MTSTCETAKQQDGKLGDWVVVGSAEDSSTAAAAVVEGVVLGMMPPSSTTACDKKSHAREEERDSITYANHVLAASDDLNTLALRYGSTGEGIMRANGMLSKDLDFLPVGCVLRIPLTHEKPLDEIISQPPRSTDAAAREKQALLVKGFAVRFDCPVEEARYYLEDAQFDVARAELSLQQDREWEKNHGDAARRASKALSKVKLHRRP